MKLLSFAIAIFACLLNYSTSTSAQPRKELFGEIPIESTDSRSVTDYAGSQSAALQYVKTVSDIIQKKTDSSGLQKPDEGVIFYFSGLYLYCSSKAGACPFILEALLAGEYLHNKSSGNKSCSSMKALWQNWLKNEFEQRLSYLVTLGANARMKSFNSTERSRYVKCEETLTTYRPDQETDKNLSMTLRLIEQIQAKGINVFEETGALKPPPAGDK